MTEEEVDAFVQEKVHGNLLPWEANPRPGGSCNTFRAQEVTLRAIIFLQGVCGGTVPWILVRKVTGYSRNTHHKVATCLRRKGAIKVHHNNHCPSLRRSYSISVGRSDGVKG